MSVQIDSAEVQNNTLLRQQQIADLIYLMENVSYQVKVTCIQSVIRRNDKFDHYKAQYSGDDYYKAFLYSLNAAQIAQDHASILKALEHPSNRSNRQTANALEYVKHKIQAPTPSSVIQEAYNAFGKVFQDTAKEEEDKQYHAANVADPDRTLEARELKLCEPYASLLSDNLALLKRNDPENSDYKKFNGIIRRLLLKYQDDLEQAKRNAGTLNISTAEAELRAKLHANLRYSLKKLSDSLESKGREQEASTIRKIVFGAKYAGDNVVSALQRPDKHKPNVFKPIVTSRMQQQAQDFISNLKTNFMDWLQAMRFIKPKLNPTIIAESDQLQHQVDNVLTAQAQNSDPEAMRRLALRLAKVRAEHLKLELEQVASAEIEPDAEAIAQLTFAYETQLSKLRKRTATPSSTPTPEPEKSYYPKFTYK
jgi:hypothetical protein